MRKLVLALALIALVSTSVSANILNPSFEEDNFGIPGYIPNWTIYGQIDGLHSGNYFGLLPSHGSKYIGNVASWGAKTGGVYQQVSLAAGQWIVGADFQAASNNSAFVYAGGQPSSFPGNVTGQIRISTTGGTDPNAANILGAEVDTGFMWQTVTQTFTLQNPATVTIFLHLVQRQATWGNWSAADNVTLVPEPMSLMVLGGGLAGLAGMIRRKKA